MQFLFTQTDGPLAFSPPAERQPTDRNVGKYRVSPLVKGLDNGWFASSVSIRSGTGTASTDRVLRLPRLFRCADQASVYAHAEALQWISASPRPLAA